MIRRLASAATERAFCLGWSLVARLGDWVDDKLQLGCDTTEDFYTDPTGQVWRVETMPGANLTDDQLDRLWTALKEDR